MKKLRLLKLFRFKKHLHDNRGWTNAGLWEIIGVEGSGDEKTVTIRRVWGAPSAGKDGPSKFRWDYLQKEAEYVEIVPVDL